MTSYSLSAFERALVQSVYDKVARLEELVSSPQPHLFRFILLPGPPLLFLSLTSSCSNTDHLQAEEAITILDDIREDDNQIRDNMEKKNPMTLKNMLSQIESGFETASDEVCYAVRQ